MKMLSKIEKAFELTKREGPEIAARYCLSYLGYAFFGRRLLSVEDICYQKWRKRNAPSRESLEAMRAEAASFKRQPLISVIMPVYNVDPALLRRATDSVERQLYTKWELCMVDDGSSRPETRAEMRRLAALGPRVKVQTLERNTGIANASNAAIGLAEGEFVALLDHDDELAPEALFEVVKMLNEHPETDMIYTDEDKLDERGRHVEVFLKPDWSPETLLSTMYTCHLGAYRKNLVEQIGGFREGFDGAQDYDLALRLTERTDKIRHVPKVLYHWRRSATSTASDYLSGGAGKKPRDSSLRALREAMVRRRIEATVEPSLFDGSYRVRPLIKGDPLVTVIIPTRDNLSFLRPCIQSVDENTYRNVEIIVVDNRSEEQETKDFLDNLGSRQNVKVIPFDEEFHFAKMNNMAAERAEGSYLLLLNVDTRAIEPDWLASMLEVAQIPGVAIVGSKLLFPDDTIQHAGIVLWQGGTAGHLHSRLPRDSHGYFGIVDMIRNCSAVTAACMLMRKDVFDELGGFDTNLAISYQDVDFCLRAREAGYRTVYTPFSLLYHHESGLRGKPKNEADEAVFRQKWEKRMPLDPFHSPNFPRDRLDCRLNERKFR